MKLTADNVDLVVGDVSNRFTVVWVTEDEDYAQREYVISLDQYPRF